MADHCNYPHCRDYDERCLTGINVPCAAPAPIRSRSRRAERVLLIALAVALMLSVAGLTVRALQIGEYQRQIERV